MEPEGPRLGLANGDGGSGNAFHEIPVHTHDKKVVKRWNMKAKLPFVPSPSSTQPNFESFDTDSLSCGCSCLECKTTYRAYWLMSTECSELKRQLTEEKRAMTMTIKEVQLMEKGHAKAMAGVKAEVEAEQRKFAVIEKQLNDERQMRIEDLFSAQRQIEEASASLKQNAELKLRIALVLEDLSSLQTQFDQLQTKAKDSAMVNRSLIKQIEKSNIEIQQLEIKYAELRQNLFNSATLHIEALKQNETRSQQRSQRSQKLPPVLHVPVHIHAVPLSMSMDTNNTDSGISAVSRKNGSRFSLMDVSRDLGYRSSKPS